MGLELARCQRLLEAEIKDPSMIRQDVAMSYGLALRSAGSDLVDWAKINRAIMERWSLSALKTIKRWAWSGKIPKPKHKTHDIGDAALGFTLCGRDWVLGKAWIVTDRESVTCEICKRALKKREGDHG